jgi:hypothetical protein
MTGLTRLYAMHVLIDALLVFDEDYMHWVGKGGVFYRDLFTRGDIYIAYSSALFLEIHVIVLGFPFGITL